jgi:phosphoglycerol transferase MdoB-like AlkP superfamily enzyme
MIPFPYTCTMSIFRLLAKLLLFWLLFFIVQQASFLAVNFSSFHGSAGELLYSFISAYPLNITATAYVMALTVLLVIAGVFGLKPGIVNGFIKWETIIFIVVCSLIGAGDLGLYKVWGTKINAKALAYLQYPDEVMPTLFAIQNLGLLLIAIAQMLFGFWLLKKLREPFVKPEWKLWHKPVFALFAAGLCVLAFRGGFQRVPINRNWVFQSKHAILNYAALNGFWNTAELIFKPLEKQENPYLFFDLQTAQKYTDELYQKNTLVADSTTQILTTQTPNIVIVFLESWAADVIGCLGGETGVTPKFEELKNDGLLFTQFYSTGFRTEQGYLATLSATPALPVGSVIQSFGKFDKLPNLYKEFNEAGYHTSFYTGGRLFFDNVEAYLKAAGVQSMKGEDEWEIHKRTVWGAYDEETFAYHLNEINTLPQPFFTTVSTMTTHEWFDADIPKIFSGDNDNVNDNYRNTMHYADSCLFAYLSQAQKQPWYNNTLFIVMADHSCKFPKNRNNYDQQRHHIPLLITGGALKPEWKGKSINRVGSHTDIAATLLTQLNKPATNFPYSKNMFNAASPAFAYYAFDNGFGMITDNSTVIYDRNRNAVITEKPDNKLEMTGKAFLEIQFQENLDYATQMRKQ